LKNNKWRRKLYNKNLLNIFYVNKTIYYYTGFVKNIFNKFKICAKNNNTKKYIFEKLAGERNKLGNKKKKILKINDTTSYFICKLIPPTLFSASA